MSAGNRALYVTVCFQARLVSVSCPAQAVPREAASANLVALDACT